MRLFHVRDQHPECNGEGADCELRQRDVGRVKNEKQQRQNAAVHRINKELVDGALTENDGPANHGNRKEQHELEKAHRRGLRRYSATAIAWETIGAPAKSTTGSTAIFTVA